jgi:hypothetical protein
MDLLIVIQRAFSLFLPGLSNNDSVYNVEDRDTQLRIEARRIS